MSQYVEGMARPTGFEEYVRPEHANTASLSEDHQDYYYSSIRRCWKKGLARPQVSWWQIDAFEKLASMTGELEGRY